MLIQMLSLYFFASSDLAAVTKLYTHLKAAMPRVTPHYAVKCFPDHGLLATLASIGCGFDCASANEAQKVCR
jgi:ornithine decarboxylase